MSTNTDFNTQSTNTNTDTGIDTNVKDLDLDLEDLYDNIAPPPVKKVKRGYGGRRKKMSKAQQRLVWRRNSLMSHLVRGESLNDISNLMHIPYRTLYDDYPGTAEGST